MLGMLMLTCWWWTCWLAHIRNMLLMTSKPKVHMSRPGHRLSVTQRKHQWLHWRLPQVLGNDGMFSVKITFLSWLMAPSLLPPVRSPGDMMWLRALSTRCGICCLPVCSNLFTREANAVLFWPRLRSRPPPACLTRRHRAGSLGHTPFWPDYSWLEGVTWSPPAAHSEGRSRTTWPRPLGHRRPIGPRLTSLSVRL